MASSTFTKKLIASFAVVAILGVSNVAFTQTPAPQQSEQQAAGAMLGQYCTGCHSPQLRTAGIVVNAAGLDQVPQNAETWEKVVRQLRQGGMPPPGSPRPAPAVYARTATFLEGSLDRVAAANPNPGDLPDLHRLTRTEYKNAIRDLLALDNLPKEMDYEFLLPTDNASSGFDNLADLLYLSPATMERYLDAARKVARLAVGDPTAPVMVNSHRTPDEGPQTTQLEELGFGTRGGLAVRSYFPLDGEYGFQVETAGGGRDAHEMEITIDGERKQLITLEESLVDAEAPVVDAADPLLLVPEDPPQEPRPLLDAEDPLLEAPLLLDAEAPPLADAAAVDPPNTAFPLPPARI